MKRLKIVALLAALAVGSAGCDTLLDVQDTSAVDASVIFQSQANVEAALLGAYAKLADNRLYGGQLLYMSELLGDGGEIAWSGTFFPQRDVWLKRIETDNAIVTNTWTQSYDAINRANIVLSGLTPDIVEDEAVRRRFEGEAKFLRGMFYFDLARYYGKPWSAGNQGSNLAVPLVLTPSIQELTPEGLGPRASVQDIYNQVISDLTDAKNLLPEVAGFRATTWIASALLSRVYLQQERWQEAAEEATRVIESGRYQLMPTYPEAFNSPSNTQEDVFAVQITPQDPANNWNSMNQFFAASAAGGRGDVDILQPHLDLYEEGDDRLAFFYVDPATGDTRTGKWNNRSEGNVNLVRLAEMYLTRAEANLRAGSSIGGQTPLQDVNRIRQRAGVDALGSVTVDDILLERRRELAFEGHHLHDLKRTRRDISAEFPFDHPRIVFPIPQREMDVNENLVQNEGYPG